MCVCQAKRKVDELHFLLGADRGSSAINRLKDEGARKMREPLLSDCLRWDKKSAEKWGRTERRTIKAHR